MIPRDVKPGTVALMPGVDPDQRRWLIVYIVLGPDWAEKNNPPAFVTDKACWEKAKRAAFIHVKADDPWAFANAWYHDNCA